MNLIGVIENCTYITWIIVSFCVFIDKKIVYIVIIVFDLLCELSPYPNFLCLGVLCFELRHFKCAKMQLPSTVIRL